MKERFEIASDSFAPPMKTIYGGAVVVASMRPLSSHHALRYFGIAIGNRPYVYLSASAAYYKHTSCRSCNSDSAIIHSGNGRRARGKVRRQL